MKDVMLETLQRCAEWHAKSAELCRVKAEMAAHRKETDEAERHERARSGHLAYKDAVKWAITQLRPKPKALELANEADENRENTAKLFPAFWNAYPKKLGKQKAEEAWLKLYATPATLATILHGLEKWKASDSWRKDGGTFIPYPATWLNGKEWMNAPTPISLDQPATPATADPVGWHLFLNTENQPYKPYRTAPEYLRIKFNDTRK